MLPYFLHQYVRDGTAVYINIDKNLNKTRLPEVKPLRPWSFFNRKIMHAWHCYKRIKCVRNYLQCCVVHSQYCCFQLLSEVFRAEFQ